MTTPVQLNGNDRLRQHIDEAELKIRDTLGRLREQGIKGVTLDARIEDDGAISVHLQQIDPLTFCDPRDLPLRALIAFSTRCARRVLPFLLPLAAHPHSVLTIAAALDKAEGYVNGTGETTPDSLFDSFQSVEAVGHEIDLLSASPSEESAVLAAGHALNTTYLAVRGAAEAAGEDHQSLLRTFRELRFEAAVAAAHAAQSLLPSDAPSSSLREAARSGTADCNRAMTADYRNLLALKLGQFPMPGNLLEPSAAGLLGPLWAEGEPAWIRDALESGTWETIEQMQDDLSERRKIEDLTPAYDRLWELAERFPPPASWFEENNQAT